MKKIYKKSKIHIMVIIFLVFSISLIGCSKEHNNKDINFENKKENKLENYKEALRVEKVKDESITQIKVTNKSNFDVSGICLIYDEVDKNNNVITNSKNLIDITLNPSKVVYSQISTQEYTKDINITGYEYSYKEDRVFVDLNKDTVKVGINNVKTENSNPYEILYTSDINKINESKEGFTYEIKVKNLSQNDLGNTTLKLAELNDKGEYIKITHTISSNVLKSNEKAKIEITSSKDAKDLKLIGYIYDDINNKANVDIDLQAHKAKINK